MDISHFKETAPGKLITIPENGHAFIPDPLPPDWDFPLDLWPLLAETKQQIGILEGIGRNLPNPAILLRPLSDREAIRSSRLEGTYVTPKELLLFELDPKDSKSERTPINDQKEVFNYRRALHHGTTSDLPLSLRLIRELHQILMEGVRGRDRTPGEFRRKQVGIGSRVEPRFVPPPPKLVMEHLSPLEKYFHLETSRYDPMVDCFLAHYQFETIHPFEDGNGRVGRLLLSIMLQKKCRLSKPWLYLSEYYEKYRDDYIDRLYRVSTEAKWQDWIEFCLHGTLEQAKDAIERCARLLAIRANFMQRLSDAGGNVRLTQIVENVFHSPFVQVASLPGQLGITYPTAKADIDRLVRAGILSELPGVWPKTYFAPEVYGISYERLDNE